MKENKRFQHFLFGSGDQDDFDGNKEEDYYNSLVKDDNCIHFFLKKLDDNKNIPKKILIIKR